MAQQESDQTGKVRSRRSTTVKAMKLKRTKSASGHATKTVKTRRHQRIGATDRMVLEVNMPDLVSTDVAVSTMERVMQMIGTRRRKMSEEHIESLVNVFLADAPRSEVEADLEVDNARLRAEYLQSTKLFTSTEVRERSGLQPKNKSEPASRWKRDRKLFSVPHRGMELFPAFQFKDGKPNPLIARVLKVLPVDYTPWQVAFWFASGNGWLDGEAPEDALDAPQEVLAAAERESELAIG